MNPPALVPMRLAATVVHALPGVRIRLRDGERTLVEVARPPLPPGRLITPCGFRNAVARAHRQLEAGHRLRFLELEEGASPTVDVAVSAPGCVYPGGLLRIAVGPAHVHAFPTTLPSRRCRAVLAADLHDDGGLSLHHDAATDVTIVHAIRTGLDATEQPPLLEDAMLRCASEEIAHDLRALTLTGPSAR